MLLTDQERCNLSKMPGKLLVTSRFASFEDKLDMRSLTVSLADRFRQQGQDFQLFAPYNNVSNLLFDDATTSMVAIPNELSSGSFETVFRQYFDSSYDQVPVSKGSDSCKLTITSGSRSLVEHSIELSQIITVIASNVFSLALLYVIHPL